MNQISRMLSPGIAVAALAIGLGVSAADAGTYALVTINQQALFFNQINDGAKAASDAGGDKLVIFNANNVPSAQNDAIENYITQKVDGIVLVAIDVNGVKPAITAAKKAGIPIVAVDAQIPNGDNAAFVGVDNSQAGQDIGKFFTSYVKDKMGGSAKVGIVRANRDSLRDRLRTRIVLHVGQTRRRLVARPRQHRDVVSRARKHTSRARAHRPVRADNYDLIVVGQLALRVLVEF